MKWKTILLLSLLFFLANEVAAQSAHFDWESCLIDRKYLPEPCMQPNTDAPKYGYFFLKEEESEESKDKKFMLWINYQYEEAYPFSKPTGLARVKLGDKYGFITTSNKRVIAIRFDQADNFNEQGYCRVVLDGKYGVIDTKGNFVVPNIYDTMDDLHNGWYEVSKDDVWGYVHRTNVYTQSREEYQKKYEAGLRE